MQIKFNKNQVKGILKLYYKKLEDTNCEILIESEKIKTGHGYDEDETCIVTFTQIIKLNSSMLGHEIEMSRNLTKDDIKNVFKTILEEENIEVQSIEYNIGKKSVTSRWSVYDTEYEPYFNGIDVEVKQLQKTIQKVIKA